MSLSQRIGTEDGEPVYVLAYHRVDELTRQPLLDPSLISATPSLFEQEMELIAREYHPISAEEMVDAVERGTRLPHDAVLVTVDDGYRDFKEVIFPAAHSHGIRPVLFVATAYVGQGTFWWDLLYRVVQFTGGPQLESPVGTLPVATLGEKKRALDKLRAHMKEIPADQALREIEQLKANLPADIAEHDHATLDWEELRALSRAGATIAAHTHTHPILSKISLEQAREEICRSQDLIAREIGHALPLFAFPDGKPQAFDRHLIQILQEENFTLVFTMVEGRARLKHDNLLCLPRLGMSARMSLAQFHFHLTPAYSYWKSIRG
jgi:peptidoglycan/xylan/chitin deacetylase (PgdA/CDA1 family)